MGSLTASRLIFVCVEATLNLQRWLCVAWCAPPQKCNCALISWAASHFQHLLPCSAAPAPSDPIFSPVNTLLLLLGYIPPSFPAGVSLGQKEWTGQLSEGQVAPPQPASWLTFSCQNQETSCVKLGVYGRAALSLRTLSLSPLSSCRTHLWAEEVSVFTREITACKPLYHYHQQCRHTSARVAGIMACPLQNVHLKIKLKENKKLKDISYIKTFRPKTRSVAINQLTITTAELMFRSRNWPVADWKGNLSETDLYISSNPLATLTRSLHLMSNK